MVEALFAIPKGYFGKGRNRLFDLLRHASLCFIVLQISNWIVHMTNL